MITWEKAEEIFDKIKGLAREEVIQTILELVNKEEGSSPHKHLDKDYFNHLARRVTLRLKPGVT